MAAGSDDVPLMRLLRFTLALAVCSDAMGIPDFSTTQQFVWADQNQNIAQGPAPLSPPGLVLTR
jgi:hypothetical protein